MKLSGLVVAAWCLCGVAVAQDTPSLTPQTLQAALAAKPEGAEAEKLVSQFEAHTAVLVKEV